VGVDGVVRCAHLAVPFQNNTNFNVGPLNGTQNILNIQPVIPFEVDKEWNIITRTILTLIWRRSATVRNVLVH